MQLHFQNQNQNSESDFEFQQDLLPRQARPTEEGIPQAYQNQNELRTDIICHIGAPYDIMTCCIDLIFSICLCSLLDALLPFLRGLWRSHRCQNLWVFDIRVKRLGSATIVALSHLVKMLNGERTGRKHCKTSKGEQLRTTKIMKNCWCLFFGSLIVPMLNASVSGLPGALSA